MVSKKWISIFIFQLSSLIVLSSASAQTVTEMFNPPAKEYILGNNAAASNLVTSALTQYPTDEKLLKLKELIEQQKEQQDQQNQDQQNQDQQDQDQQDQQDQDQQDQDQEQQDQQNQEEQEPQEAQPSPAQQAGEMSEEEAQQLLDAMKQNEKDQRTDLRPILGQPVRVDKDW